MIKTLKHLDEILKMYKRVDNNGEEGYCTVINRSGLRATINIEMKQMMRDRAAVEVTENNLSRDFGKHYNYDYVMTHYQHGSTSCWAFCKEWFEDDDDKDSLDPLFDIK